MNSTGQSDKRRLTEVPGAGSYSWNADSSSANQQIFFTLRDPKVHHFVQNSPPFVCMLGQMNPDHNLPPHYSQLYPGFPSYLFPSSFPTINLHVSLFTPYVPHAQPIASFLFDIRYNIWWLLHITKLLIMLSSHV